MFRLFLLFAGFLSCMLGALGAQNTTFEKISIENGLSQGMIFDLCQTRDGFLWVATKDGLNRYDGYNFKVFANNPFDPFSIAENNAVVLFEDSRGWLWAGLNSKGVDVFEPKTGRFHHFPIPACTSKIYNSSVICSIAEAPDGSIWAAQFGGVLWRIPIPTDWQNGIPGDAPHTSTQARQVPLAIENEQYLKGLTDILRLSTGEMLVSSFCHQFLFDPKTLAYRPHNEDLLTLPTPDHRLYQCSIHDQSKGGDAWFVRLNKDNSKPECLRLRNGQTTVFPFQNKQTGLYWYRMARGANGHTWLSIYEKVWDLAPGEDLDLEHPDAVFDQYITCFETDRAGNLWFGTNGYGLRKINPKKNDFQTGAAGLSLGPIKVNGGRYFVNQSGWVFDYDPQTRLLSEKPCFFNGDKSVWHTAMVFEPSGAIWLVSGTRNTRNLSLYHFAPGNFAQPDKKIDLQDEISDFSLMHRTRDGRLWLPGNKNRLVRFDPVSERFDYFDFSHLFSEKSHGLYSTSIAEDDDGTFWLGTTLGLVKCLPAEGDKFDFQLFATDPQKPKDLNNNNIAHVLPQPDGQIWIATKGGGINILDKKTGNFRHITTDDGLLNNVIYGVLPGNRSGEFWCSTNRGLAKIMAPPEPDGKFAIITYTASTGLQDDEFNTSSFCKSPEGELLFGGINGLNRFFPEKLIADTVPPPVLIVGIEINHEKNGIPSPESLRKLELGHDQNNVSIEFAALDFTDPSKNRYRYRLVGLDDDWVETGNLRFAHFSHLSPGKYTLRVQGSNGESAWREAPPLVLVVNPPWWRSNLAYFCYLLLLGWGGWRAYQFQIQRVKEREQLAFEHRETERVKALEQMKTNFFSNVTHEFRTPLTLIIEPLRRILQKNKDAETLENARLAEKNSQQLLSLVNQLLDMAKLESGQMSLDLRRADLAETVRGVFERFLPLAEKRGVKLVFRQDIQDLKDFEFDKGKVELILNNLISNALKFTLEGGRVEVNVGGNVGGKNVGRVLNPADVNPADVRIQIRDTGIGIAPENLDRIFDRFYQVDGSNTRAGDGTGIGLALSKELAELMGGGISVESELGKGSTFAFWIPMDAGASVGVTQSPPDTMAYSPQYQDKEAMMPPVLRRPPSSEAPIVLVIEDNPELRHFTKTALSGAGWQVVEASDGEEGAKKAFDLVPDLVVSDLMMPRKDGLAVVDELKNAELTAHIPIILLTAKSGIESKLAGLRRGADDYLTKPFNTDELLARMENLLENRRRLRQLFGAKTAPGAPSTAEGEGFLEAPDREFLQKFTLVLETNLDDEKLGVEDFAKKMFISRVQLHRKLKAITDKNATDFIREFRLDRAYSMLKNREGMVSEVALRVGFGNEKYFSTVFKAQFGVSPSQVW